MTDTTVPTALLERLAQTDAHTFTQAELEPLRDRLTGWLAENNRGAVPDDLITSPSGWPLTWADFAAHLRTSTPEPYDFETALTHLDIRTNTENRALLEPLHDAYVAWMRDRGRDNEDNISASWARASSAPSNFTVHLSTFREWLHGHPGQVPGAVGTSATQPESKPTDKWQELGFASEEAYATFSRKVAETANRLSKCEEADQFAEELGLIPRQEMTRTKIVQVPAFQVTIEVPFTDGVVHFGTTDTSAQIRAAIQQHVTDHLLPLRQYTFTHD